MFAPVLHNYTKTPADPIDAPGKARVLFTFTLLSTGYSSEYKRYGTAPFATSRQRLCPRGPSAEIGVATGLLTFYVALLILFLFPVVLLAEYFAVIVDYGIEDLDLPDTLGGILIAILVLAPEGLTAFHAALANRLQRAMNVWLASALSTISL